MVGTAWKQLWVCVQPPPSHTRVDTRVLLWSVRQEQNERVHLSSLPFSLNTTQHKHELIISHGSSGTWPLRAAPRTSSSLWT